MREDEIYFYTKELLKLKNFKIIAGQPPNGSDNIPSIEIKESNHFDKGSKGSFKPDLVAIDRNNFLIIECKPKYDFNDKKKLESVLFDNKMPPRVSTSAWSRARAGCGQSGREKREQKNLLPF